MKITVAKDRTIQLEEVYNGVQLKTRDGETMGICMRDSGFEFNYQGKWYSAQQGVITEEVVSNKSRDNKTDNEFPNTPISEAG